jgi:hypothetical protein
MTSIIVDFNRSALAEHRTLDGFIEREETGNVSTWLRSASAFDFSGIDDDDGFVAFGFAKVGKIVGDENGSDVLSAFLDTHLGLRYRSLVESVALTVVYVAILVTGVVGNVCTCLVVAVNGHMHTATNYYLFSLAVSDALTLVLGKTLRYVEFATFHPQENADFRRKLFDQPATRATLDRCLTILYTECSKHLGAISKHAA